MKLIMKRKILFILLCGVLFLGMTGCGNNKNETKDLNAKNNINDANDTKKTDDKETPDINNEKDNDKENNQQSTSKSKTTRSKNENQKDNQKDDVKQNNQITETPKNENQSTNKDEEQTVNKNEPVETPPKKTTFNVRNYVLHYGKYSGICTKLIDTSIVNATITIDLKEDGTYTYTSTNQEVSKNRSGTYNIKDDYIIVLNSSEPLEYSVLGDDYFLARQGSSFSFTYQGS